jgi:hypothetical protein
MAAPADRHRDQGDGDLELRPLHPALGHPGVLHPADVQDRRRELMVASHLPLTDSGLVATSVYGFIQR